MAPPILTLQNIQLTFGGTPLLTGADLTISQGDKLCLVGRNGSGKSTLLKIAAGEVEADAGARFVQPGTTIRYLRQEPDFTGFKTVRDFVESGLGPGDDPYRIHYILDQLGLEGDEDPAVLSGGEARRAALAHALSPKPDILLLDEPTNHLDLPAIEWLETELQSMRSAMVLISHDRRFLENLSRSTIWLDRGITRSFNQGFSGFEEWRDKLLEEEATDAHKLERKIAMEDHWVRYGVTARRKRNQKRMRLLREMRTKRQKMVGEISRSANTVAMEVGVFEKSGKLVIKAEHISKSFEAKSVVKDFSIIVQRGDKIGFVGPNGSGKTTLIKLLTGTLESDEGTLKLGANLDMVTLDQQRASLEPEWTLKDALTGGDSDMVFVAGKQKHVASYMKDFLFVPEQMNTPITALSGGERGRLMLARALAQTSNLLVLDEPTNDLDLETLDLLQEMLSDYPGTVLLVSHDRDFIDRIVATTVSTDGEGIWTEYAGGYSDMVAQRGAIKKQAAETAKREKQKSTQASAKQKTKLSFKDKHALEVLPGQMAQFETEIEKLKATLAQGNLYASDPEQFQTTANKLEATQAELAQAEEQWLGLELLREELDGNLR